MTSRHRDGIVCGEIVSQSVSEFVMTSSSPAIQVDRATLQQLIVKLLQRKGMFIAEAEIVAERLIDADSDGRPQDGTGSLPEILDAMDLGDIDPRARVITISETPAIAVLDGSTGVGHVATTKAMLMAIEKAAVVGTGTVIIKNSRPCGDLGGIARLAAGRNQVGMVATSFPDGHDMLAWSVPRPDGRRPLVQRHRHEGLDQQFASFGALLSAGLAGSDLPPRKRKPVRAANVVEYCLMAINQDLFGAKDSLASKWQSFMADNTIEPTADSSTTVQLQADDAQRLAELAAKIKFAVTW